jgi:hypothetical protein
VQIALSRTGNPKQLIVPTSDSGDALDYIAYDGATPLININQDVKGPATIYARGWNEDPANAHWIKILLDVTPLG